MDTFLSIPFLSPIKFVPSTSTPGVHFDDDYAFNRIKSFETKAAYYQKWQIGDSTPIQVESTIIPDDLKIYDCTGTVKKSIPFTKTADGASLGINIYEAMVTMDDLTVNKTYYIFIRAAFMGVQVKAISEAIILQNEWPDTMSFKYRNSFNDFGVAFTTGLEYGFRCEAGIMDFNPDNEGVDYIDQIHNTEVLSSTPFRTFKLYIGDERGVAPWVLDLMNRIFSCDHVEIEGMQYARNKVAKFEITRVKPWPLYAGSIEITPSQNASGLQLTDPSAMIEGVVTAYDIDTNFFGTTKDDMHIIDIELTD